MTGTRSLLVTVGLLLTSCTSQAQEQNAPLVRDVTASDYAAPKLPLARVVLTDAYGGKHVVKVEVAATRESRTRGLMWRTRLDEGAGMLFIFPIEERLSFWMKNTLISLDLLFLAGDLSIVGIEKNAQPKTLTSRGPERHAKFVIEVTGGWIDRHGIQPESQVQIEGISGIRVSD